MPCVEVMAFVEAGSRVVCVCWWQMVGCVGDGLLDFPVVGNEGGDGFGVGFHQGDAASDFFLDELHGLAVAEVEGVIWS